MNHHLRLSKEMTHEGTKMNAIVRPKYNRWPCCQCLCATQASVQTSAITVVMERTSTNLSQGVKGKDFGSTSSASSTVLRPCVSDATSGGEYVSPFGALGVVAASIAAHR